MIETNFALPYFIIGIVLLLVGVLIVNTLGISQRQDWWVKIVTEEPHCTYYFGPFSTAQEARNHRQGYVEDITAEGAQKIQVEIQQAQPQQMTVIGSDG